METMDRTPVNFVGLWAFMAFGVAALMWRLSSNRYFVRGGSRLHDMPQGRGCLLTLAVAIPIGLVFPLVVFLT